jgi:prevent-host-death family protein
MSRYVMAHTSNLCQIMAQANMAGKESRETAAPPPDGTSRIAAVDLRNNLGDALNRVSLDGERFAMTRFGRDVAVLISVPDYERLLAFEADDRAARK